MQQVKVSKINQQQLILDPDLQPRVKMNEDKIEEYSELLREGVVLPPPIVFYDSSRKKYLVADGFHRVKAHRQNGSESFECEIRPGGKREAILWSCGANATHGLNRTNDDKNRAVTSMVLDPEWSQWSNVQIARHCGVGEKLVRTVRRICGKGGIEDTPNTGKGFHTSAEPKYETGDGSPDASPDSRETGAATRTFTHPKTGKPTKMRVGGIGKSTGSPGKAPHSDAGEPNEPDTPQPSYNDPEPSGDIPKGFEEAWEIVPKLKAVVRELHQARRTLQNLSVMPGGEILSGSMSQIEADIKNLVTAISFSTPHSLCSYCNGRKCGTCSKRGWQNERTAKTAGKMKEAV